MYYIMPTFLVVTLFPFRIVVDVEVEEKLGPPIDELELIELNNFTVLIVQLMSKVNQATFFEM